MPAYDYKCSECSEEWEQNYKMDDRNIPLGEPCPKCGATDCVTQKIGSGGIGDAIRMGLTKPPAGFNEVLRNISKVSPNNTMKIRD
jgi:putative FmdB family regulatory protein